MGGMRRTENKCHTAIGNFGIITIAMCMLDRVRERRDELHEVARRHKVEKLWVFGSCARKEEREDSDIDFLVGFSGDVGYHDYQALENDFASMFRREVNVVPVSTLDRQPFFAYNVRKDMVAV